MTFKRQDTESTLGYVTSISKSLDQFQNIRRPGSLPAACLESRQIMTPYFCFECDSEHLQDTVTGPAFVTLPKNPKVERGFHIVPTTPANVCFVSDVLLQSNTKLSSVEGLSYVPFVEKERIGQQEEGEC
ncbi:hypothetical protein N7536_009788 [Penicillium majusculum]|nr:hypothetical protein N7536_009788 [Penicillium majusculum]